MKYTKHSINQNNKRVFITDWAYKEGVFLTPSGAYIARVKNKGKFNTISQHKTELDAKAAYDNHYKTT